MKKFEHGGDVYGRNIRFDFSVNTNPLGLSERIKEAVINSAGSFGIYPDINYTALKRAIARYEGVRENNVVCSNGASEMIFAAVRALMPKRAVLVSPTFSEYERALLSVGCEIEYYEAKEENDFRVDSDFVACLEGKDMVFICNPNNPTGALCDKTVMEKIAEKNVTCIVDECFMDLADGYSVKGRLPVIKAFTKTYAMAGLRLGYLIADEALARRVSEQLPAWNVSAAAQAAGIAALECDSYLAESVELIKREREYLSGELMSLGFKVFKSYTNFILIKGREGIAKELLRRGILIRECDNFRSLDKHFYRIAVKTHIENEILIKELRDVCG